MVFNNDGQETVRRYLLGQLAEDEQATVEQRLLTEEGFLEEWDSATDEVVEDYLAKELTDTEREWFEQNFLASPTGIQRKSFAAALHRYALDHPPPSPKKMGLAEKLTAFWNRQQTLLRAATAAAVVIVVVSIFWLSRPPSPQGFATVTLNHSITTRSTGTDWPKVKLPEEGLRATLSLPSGSTPDARYRVDLLNESGEKRTFEVEGRNAQSVTVDVPAAQLTRGRNVITLSTVNAEGTVQRIPGGYHFIVE